jgi:hypothetical protein
MLDPTIGKHARKKYFRVGHAEGIARRAQALSAQQQRTFVDLKWPNETKGRRVKRLREVLDAPVDRFVSHVNHNRSCRKLVLNQRKA